MSLETERSFLPPDRRKFLNYTKKEKELLSYMEQGYNLFNRYADPDFLLFERKDVIMIEFGRLNHHSVLSRLSEEEKEERVWNLVESEEEKSDKKVIEPELKRARAWKAGKYNSDTKEFTKDYEDTESVSLFKILKYVIIFVTIPVWLPVALPLIAMYVCWKVFMGTLDRILK